MTVNAITDTKKGITGIAPTYLHTTLTNQYKIMYYLRKMEFKYVKLGLH